MDYKYLQELQQKVQMGKDVFIAPSAHVLGNVILGNNVSIWYGATLRADFDKIEIGDKTNVQEGVIMHVDHGIPIKIGEGNVIGHGAVLHGCTVGDYNLIGIRSTILNNAKIGKGCVIGAHALVTEGMEVPDYSMVLGTPGKIVRQLDPGTVEVIKLGTKEYMEEALRYLESV